MAVTPRLARWVETHFRRDSAERVLDELRSLPAEVVGGQDPERIQASLVIRTGGDWDAFQRLLVLARTDWRDALVGAGLGNADWPERLEDTRTAQHQPCARADDHGAQRGDAGRRPSSARAAQHGAPARTPAGRRTATGPRCWPPGSGTA